MEGKVSEGCCKEHKAVRELSEISSLLSENHIVHLPLKGCVLKKMYERFLQRTLAGENEYARIMSDEDFYVYNIAHFSKHFNNCGSGIRSVMDIYVMRKTFESHMDRPYVENALSQLNLLEFEKNVADLSECWFGDGVYKAELETTASYIIESGTYGTLSNMVNNKIKSEGKFKYLLQSAFLPYDVMSEAFPSLKKAPFLLPLFWVWRVIIAIIKRPKRVAYRIKAVAKAMFKKIPPKG